MNFEKKNVLNDLKPFQTPVTWNNGILLAGKAMKKFLKFTEA